MNEIITKKEVDRIEFMNNEYDAAKDDAKSALTHYMKIGQTLLEQQKDYYENTGKQKGFDKWIENNCNFKQSSAYSYMELGKSSSALEDYLKVAENPSLRGALRYIAPEPELPKEKPKKPQQSINEVCADLSNELVSISTPANNFMKKAKEVIEFQEQADESALWSLKKGLRLAAERMLELAESLDVTDASFKEKIAETENIVDLWTGEAS